MSIIKQIFEPEPIQWGLRGDPWLWRDLKKYFSVEKRVLTSDDFAIEFNTAFKQLTGREIVKGEVIMVKKYSEQHPTGMSAGSIACDFWIEKGLPLLLQRFSEFKSNQGTL